MQDTLNHHNQLVHAQLTATLKEYFDPSDGKFSDRVRGLVAQDGDLAQMIKGMIDGENCLFARTMMSQIGSNSPLMRQLDPQHSEGLLSVIRRTVELQLDRQRDQVLKEFSLDVPDGALSRLVRELTDRHGALGRDIQLKIDKVMKEFSLNEEGSALKRLVDNVDKAQEKICAEFSLDNDQSALKRFKTEVMTVFQAHMETSAQFQEEVKLALQKLVTKREVEAGTPRHGIEFEVALVDILRQQADQLGDIAEHTGAKTGQMKGRVVGDVVITLGPESTAPGARIVFEAKEKESYSLEKARAEMELARKNRGADIGIFVYSRKTAPDSLRPITRYGQDIFVVWDAEDPSTDIHLLAAFDIGRGLSVRQSRQREGTSADFSSIDKAILDIETRAKNLGEIDDCAKKIVGNAESIQNRIRIDRKALEQQVTQLREKVGDLRDAMQAQQ